MKISASYWIFDGGLEGTLPIKSAMEQASKMGFEGIELGIASQGVLTHNTSQAECEEIVREAEICLLYTSPSPRDKRQSRMPSSA